MEGLNEHLTTPLALLDRARLRRNCARMRETAARLGVCLRPHLKTAKCVEVAELALAEAGSVGITVSTLEEARWFAERGYPDQTYAVGITADKLDTICAFGPGIAVLTDDVATARVIGERGISAWIEIDCGQDRGGLLPNDPELLACAEALGQGLRGVLTHAGQSYACRSVAAIEAVAEVERLAAVRAAARLRAAGFVCPGVSVGSTPTAVHARSLEGVTELRAGVYMFFDRFQHAIGVCERDDLALSVLASVVSTRADAVWIDAGTLALSSEGSMEAFGGGYGEVTRPDGTSLGSGSHVEILNQAHGRVVARSGRLPELRVGDRLRVWPNHACITAAMFDAYTVIEERAELGRLVVVDRWERLRG